MSTELWTHHKTMGTTASVEVPFEVLSEEKIRSLIVGKKRQIQELFLIDIKPCIKMLRQQLEDNCTDRPGDSKYSLSAEAKLTMPTWEYRDLEFNVVLYDQVKEMLALPIDADLNIVFAFDVVHFKVGYFKSTD